jgi:hypothetical protein
MAKVVIDFGLCKSCMVRKLGSGASLSQVENIE